MFFLTVKEHVFLRTRQQITKNLLTNSASRVIILLNKLMHDVTFSKVVLQSILYLIINETLSRTQQRRRTRYL